jgi:hypothetical protein
MYVIISTKDYVCWCSFSKCNLIFRFIYAEIYDFENKMLYVPVNINVVSVGQKRNVYFLRTEIINCSKTNYKLWNFKSGWSCSDQSEGLLQYSDLSEYDIMSWVSVFSHLKFSILSSGRCSASRTDILCFPCEFELDTQLFWADHLDLRNPVTTSDV